jgi:hypothetical protein
MPQIGAGHHPTKLGSRKKGTQERANNKSLPSGKIDDFDLSYQPPECHYGFERLICAQKDLFFI